MVLLQLLLLGYAVVSVLAVLVLYATCVISSRIERIEEKGNSEVTQ